MSSVILATTSADLVRRVRVAAGGDVLVFDPEQLPPGPAQVLELAGSAGSVRAVVMDPPADRLDDSLRLASRFDQHFPAVSVLLVTEQKAELTLEALRAGVRDLLYPDASVGDIRWALDRARDAAAARIGETRTVPSATGRVVMTTSPKGGVGKTTLAVNLALGLTTHAPHGTVLVDLDVQFGDVAAALGLQPEATLADAVHGPASASVMALRTVLTRHPTGLQVLCGVSSPAQADEISPERVATMLELLKSEFQYVVLDTAPGLSAHTLAALRHTTDLVLVTSLDVPSVRGLRKELQVLDALDLPPPTRHVVVNMADRSAGVTVADVEGAIGRAVDLVVPHSVRFVQATNRGVPLVGGGGRDKITRALMDLVSRFVPGPAAPRGRWGGRRDRAAG